LFESGEHRFRVDAWKRARLRNPAVLDERTESFSRDERAVDGKDEADVVRRRSQPRDHAEDRCARSTPSSTMA
jgi:hypothetical protein